MLKRKIEERLQEWKRTKQKQGLLITGARQIGKTSSIEAFAAENYENLIKIDFVERPEAVNIISQASSIDDLIVRITALALRPLPNGKTLLFFDEIQRCEDVITWMRYLAEDGRFDVIYSGSLLGVEVYNFRSLPAGTLDIVEMFPLDFEEFSWAFGVDASLWDIVENCYAQSEEVPDFIHDRFMNLFFRYVLVGGMPEAVQVFANTHDTQAMRARQRSILTTYKADITRYIEDTGLAQNVKTIYDAVPAQLNKENKRYIITGIDKKARFKQMQSSFDWLKNAGVVIPVKRANEALYPLGMSREDGFFKLYMNDTGLLFSTFGSADVEAIIAAADNINFGQAFENAVAQELRAHGHENTYYFSTNKVGEVDFLIDDRQLPKVLPIEVKSGKYSSKHAALNALMAVSNYELNEACVLHRFNVKKQGKITYLPLYMTAFL